MRSVGRPATIVAMPARRIANLHLEVNLDADPIAGVMHGQIDGDRPFSGWMELTRAIEIALEQAREAQK